jgi:crossover junction endodeoxyribonuclease RuvC
MTNPDSLPHVVGGDISLTASAFAWPDRHTAVEGATGLANPRTYVGERAGLLGGLAARLDDTVHSRNILYGGMPRLVVLEDFPAGNTRIDPERGYLWWRLVERLASDGVPVLPVPPSTLKQYACGMGNANKREVIAGVQEFFPDWPIMKTGKNGKVLTTVADDKADAVVLMAIGCELLGEPLVELPAKHRKALDKLELPPGVRRG